jgi:signal recognition particle subunit SRP54
MINSMTKAERTNPDLLAQSPSRRRRIAKGSGHTENEVSKLTKDFTRMRALMQQMGSGNMPGMGGMGMPNLGGMGGMLGGSQTAPGFRGYGGGATKSKPKKQKKKKGFGTL